MRVTTQMLSNSALKSGVQLQQTTLVDIMNDKSSLTNLLSSTNSSASTLSIIDKNNYSKLEQASSELNDYASKLANTDENSLFSNAEKSGDTTDITQTISKIVEKYNTTLTQLKTSGDTLNGFYKQQLKDLPSDYKQVLKNIGITQSKDGTLSVDEKVLQSADIESLRSALSSEAEFTSKLSFISEHISKNASANLESVSSKYSASGTSYYSFEANRYNFLG